MEKVGVTAKKVEKKGFVSATFLTLKGFQVKKDAFIRQITAKTIEIPDLFTEYFYLTILFQIEQVEGIRKKLIKPTQKSSKHC